MLIDSEGWLLYEGSDPRVIRYSTPRMTNLEVPQPLGIVWHWTAGKGGPHFAAALAKEIEGYDPKKDRAASWHVLIAKDGTIHQSAPFLRGTWHVGRAGKIGVHQTGNVNKCLVGCELENAGRLLMLGMRAYCWPYWLNPDAPHREREVDPRLEVDASRAVLGEAGFWKDAEGGYFDAYSQAQEDSATAMLRALVSTYGWTPTTSSYGHCMFDYPRKEDPGPLWLKQALPRIMGSVFVEKVPDP